LAIYGASEAARRQSNGWFVSATARLALKIHPQGLDAGAAQILLQMRRFQHGRSLRQFDEQDLGLLRILQSHAVPEHSVFKLTQPGTF
jgi:hypothetical protein